MDNSTPEPQPQPPSLRASDAERERVASLLQKHFADGRIAFDELQERLGQAYGARTHGDLDKVLEDLPQETEPLPQQSPPPQPAPRNRRVRTRYEYLASYIVFSLFLIAIWSASGRHGSFWPIWPIIVFGAFAMRRLARDLWS
jgi:Domain of unknown function (DUF1707)